MESFWAKYVAMRVAGFKVGVRSVLVVLLHFGKIFLGVCFLFALFSPVALYSYLWESIFHGRYAGWGIAASGAGWVLTVLAAFWLQKMREVARFKAFLDCGRAVIPVRGSAAYELGEDQGGFPMYWFKAGTVYFDGSQSFEARDSSAFNEIQELCLELNPDFRSERCELTKYSLA